MRLSLPTPRSPLSRWSKPFDAWESWDVIHSAPERLRWGIWAYSHAGVKTPHGLKMPVGTYISWANQGERLLDENDVRFLASNINAAVADARQTTEIYGPTLVYSRESMQWQIEHATPNHDINEWIDEQLGSVIKWPVPVLSATRIEWLPNVQSDLFVMQTPSHLSSDHMQNLQGLIKADEPIAFAEVSPTASILLCLRCQGWTCAPPPLTKGTRSARPRLNPRTSRETYLQASRLLSSIRCVSICSYGGEGRI